MTTTPAKPPAADSEPLVCSIVVYLATDDDGDSCLRVTIGSPQSFVMGNPSVLHEALVTAGAAIQTHLHRHFGVWDRSAELC